MEPGASQDGKIYIFNELLKMGQEREKWSEWQDLSSYKLQKRAMKKRISLRMW